MVLSVICPGGVHQNPLTGVVKAASNNDDLIRLGFVDQTVTSILIDCP
jgi:hypothetical protein